MVWHLTSCPRKFTKLNKVQATGLHLENIPLSGYIDNFFAKTESFGNCEENIEKTMLLYDKLGFIINLKKSQIIQAQKKKKKKKKKKIGFQIDSVKMTITLTDNKKQKLLSLILQLLRIQGLSRILYMPPSKLVTLFCRTLKKLLKQTH